MQPTVALTFVRGICLLPVRGMWQWITSDEGIIIVEVANGLQYVALFSMCARAHPHACAAGKMQSSRDRWIHGEEQKTSSQSDRQRDTARRRHKGRRDSATETER